MKFKLNKIIVIVITVLILSWGVQMSSAAMDSDRDRVSDDDENFVYYTNPNNPDTDGDGYTDYEELMNDYSPHAIGLRLDQYDFDDDGLNDKFERLLGTDIGNPDTDGDGFLDGTEFYYGYDPTNSQLGVKLPKWIEIGIKEQKLRYYLGAVPLGEFLVSTGTYQRPTPLGQFKIDGKHPRAWSSWGLWMPWWMSIKNGWIGIHELPVWPNGVKEGVDHLGQRASHGCIRLGQGPAKQLYDWAELGTVVFIKQSLE